MDEKYNSHIVMTCIAPLCTSTACGLWCEKHTPVCERCDKYAAWIYPDLYTDAVIPMCLEHAPLCYLCKSPILEHNPLVLCTIEEDNRYVYICRNCKSKTRCRHDECVSPAISCFKVGSRISFTCRLHSNGCLRYACRRLRSGGSHYCYGHTKFANKVARCAYLHIVSKKLPETIMRLGRAVVVSKILRNGFGHF